MLDRDLAGLYGVSTKRLNEQVKRNIERFPEDFVFRLTRKEKKELVANCDRFKTLKHSTVNPSVFTEQGVAMLSSVLNSKRAVQVNIAIMRVFVKVRQIVSANREMLAKLDRVENKVESHDGKIKIIFKAIHMQSGAKLLSPNKPFSNKKTIRDIISSCVKYIYWVDKYFSKAGLDWLSESLNTNKVKKVRILMLPEKVNNKFMRLYKDLKKELKLNKVKFEIRCITDKKLSSSIHDRWIIAENFCYNMPSTDTVARGQYTEVKQTSNLPPFDKWWQKSRGIEKN